MNVKDIYITKSQSERLYNIAKPIIALTGGIATGKTTVSNYIKDKHQIEITDADALIKEIYRQDKTISFIKGRCSTAVINGQIDFKKPISCHLYPIRVQEYSEFSAVNYHKWPICSDACTLGNKLKVPVYKFTKEALIRKFGLNWFLQLEKLVSEL